MTRITLRITIAVFVLCTFQAVNAQNLDTKITMPATVPVITGAASVAGLRFTAPGTIVQMQLQIYAESGQKLFDVTSKGNVLDWTPQDSVGEPLNPGSYLCVVTVKSLSGKLNQRIGSVLVHEKQVDLQRLDASLLSAAEQQAVGPIEATGALTVLKADDVPATTVLANDGKEGQMIRGLGALTFRLGDFFSGNDKEQMRLSEDGSLGIGTAKPEATLDVAGTIRARKGFSFLDGSTLNINDKGGLSLTSPNGSVVPNLAGSGTQDRMVKWTDNSGTLGNTQVSESNGSVVVGNAGQTGNLQIYGTAVQDVFAGMGPDLNVGPAFNFGYAGSSFGRSAGFFNVRPDASAVAPNPSLRFMTSNVQRMIVTNTGNVGIGTPAPATPLEVNGLLRSTRNGNAAQFIQLWGGDNTSIKLTAQSILAAEKPLLIQNLSGDLTPGVNNGMFFQLGTTASPSTKMMIDPDGNVGIGITNTNGKLHVKSLGTAIYGESNSSGVYGTANTNGATGVWGDVDNGFGVYGTSFSNVGVYGSGGAYAGYFEGNVFVNGTINKAAVGFKIDHPLDPANKYLYHTGIESPDMLNLYNGNLTTDENGEATVTLPEWFEALNRDFCYQLTVIGEFAQAMVASKIKNNRFTIKTDKPHIEVSWQVTGIRQDAYANAHRMPIEEQKAEKERGYYLRPELFGQPEEKGVEWAQRPEQMRQMKEQREKAQQQRLQKERQ